MNQFSALFSNFSLSWDLGVIAFLFFAVFFYGFSVGSRKLGALLVSMYFSYVVLDIAPYISQFIDVMPDYRSVTTKIAVFVFLTLALFFLMNGSILRSSLGLPKKEDSQWWHALILSIASAGVFVSFALGFTPESFYDKLSTITLAGFLENNAQFWWAVSGIAALILLRRTKKSQ